MSRFNPVAPGGDAWSQEDGAAVSPARGPIYPTSTYVVSAGQTSSGLVEGYHGFAYWNEIVLGGGTAVQNQVTVSGHVYVSSGGLTHSDTISSGGFEVVSAGGRTSAATVSSGGVLEGAGEVIGATAYGVLSGVQVARNSPTPIFGFTDVESGGVASAVSVIDNAALDLQGGVAISTTVLDGSLFLVFGGLEQNALLSGPSAYMDVGSGCSAYYDIVRGGTMTVESGLETQSRAAAVFTFVESGGVLSNLDVVDGANIAAGGLLLNSAYALNTQIQAGGVVSDAIVSATEVSGTIQDVVGGSDSGTAISSGGHLEVADVSIGADVQAGGLLFIEQTAFLIGGGAVYVYGSASATSVESGGTVGIDDISTTLVWNAADPLPGFVEGAIFYSGSVLSYARVAFTSDYTDAGTLSGTYGSSGHVDTLSGAILEIGSAVIEGGVAVTLDDATLGSAIISGGGILYLGSGGAFVSGATVLAGALVQGDFDPDSFDDLQGSTEVYGVVLSASLGGDEPATLTVQSGGLADTVSMGYEGGAVMTVLSGGSAVYTSVAEWDTLSVARGGVVSGTSLGENGVGYIYGTAIDTTVGVLGELLGRADMVVVGAASGVDINYGGTLDDRSDGFVSGVRVSNGGLFIAESNAPAQGVMVLAGGGVDLYGAILYSGASRTLAGTLGGNGSLIEDGPGTLVMNAASTSAFTGEIVLSAGVVELERKGEATNADVVFAQDGKFATLRVDTADRPPSGTAFATSVYDFDDFHDRLDLAALAFTSGAKATVSGGVLTLKDGGYTARFVLSGTEATRYTVASDGSGGTLVHAAVGAGTQAMAEAAATFAPSGEALTGTFGQSLQNGGVEHDETVARAIHRSLA